MINKEERQLLKVFRKLKECGAKTLELIDIDIYRTSEAMTRWNLENRIKELEEIEKEHQRLIGELEEKLTKAEED